MPNEAMTEERLKEIELLSHDAANGSYDFYISRGVCASIQVLGENCAELIAEVKRLRERERLLTETLGEALEEWAVLLSGYEGGSDDAKRAEQAKIAEYRLLVTPSTGSGGGKEDDNENL
jgi:hypothetical protein